MMASKEIILGLTLKVLTSDEHNDWPQRQTDTGLPVAGVGLHLIIIVVSFDKVLCVYVQIEAVLSHHPHGGASPGAGRLGPCGIQLPRPAQHWLCLCEPPPGDRGSGVGDTREAEALEK